MTTLSSQFELTSDNFQQAEKRFLEAMRRMDDFLATLGHEMRNPLSALSNALEVWPSAKHDPELMEELRGIMQRQLRQLTRLSDDLLDVARIAQGKLELHREHVEVRQLMDAACEEIQPFIDCLDHTLSAEMPAEPVVIYGDTSRLLQVFANLIQNAAKFTPRNGSLCVTVESQNGVAVARVRDNGRGIEPHRLPAIFDRASPMNEPHASHNEGLGIGLQLVKAIVELHGGDVTARSKGLGHGSEFIVRLPLADIAANALSLPMKRHNSKRDGEVRRPHTYRVLVVDDERSSAELLAQMLRSLDQSVTVAYNGTMAIQMVLEERPQIVFLDIVLHDIDGCEVARQFRERVELDGLVLIALSGNGDEENIRRAMSAGFDKYLVKPTSHAVLAEVLVDIPDAFQTCKT